MTCAGDFMMTRVRSLGPLLVLAVLFLTRGGFAATPAAGLRLAVHVPEQVLDGAPFVAAIELTNVSNGPVTVQAPDSNNVSFDVALQQDFGTGKWVLHPVGGHSLTSSHKYKLLLAGQSVTAQLPVFRDYPMGVAPGEYTISALYSPSPDANASVWTGTLTSRPGRMTIAAPKTETYDAFLSVSRAAANHEPRVAARALEFAREYPSFAYSAQLLVELAQSADVQTAAQIAQFLAMTYPGSEFAEQGRYIAASVAQRTTDRDAYERYMSELRLYAAAPENQAVMQEARKLGTIVRPEHYETAESFVRKFPSSPMAAEALWSIIDAVQHGVYPPGYSAADRDVLLACYYRQLLALQPESYWAKQAAKSEFVRQLLAAQR